ncbi:MAG: 30S ribosome-binding factor RbfA [Phycisphaerales bacterium]|nr:30S ribosome-binding factor RbfA [Phycisphaerales bacterium]
MAKIRQQKVAAQIQKIVAMTLLREVADPRVDGLISVTKVEVTPDLREAKVYLSIIANKRPTATIFEGIKSAGRHIQATVADGLPLRFAPRLTFYLDDSLKREAEILKKIDEANRKE